MLKTDKSSDFPDQWNEFVKWALDIKKNSPSFKPCIPFFISNRWYLEKPQNIWSVWFNYYIYRKGWYSLYINYSIYPYEDDDSYYSLIKNSRADGLHFKRNSSDPLGMQDKVEFLLEVPPKMFLPPQRYPLYDYHFKFLRDSSALDNRWRIMSGVENQCILK